MNVQKQIRPPVRKLAFILASATLVILSYFIIWPYIITRELTSPYRQFVGEGTNYFAQVAGACDLILQQHPLGTNIGKFVSGSDPTIPKIIQDLHPSKISVESEPSRVSFMVGKGRAAFGVAWQHHGPKVWILNTRVENSERTIYSETKP